MIIIYILYNCRFVAPRNTYIGIITVNADATTATEAVAPKESEEESGPVRVRTFADVKDAAARAIRYVTSSSSCHKTIIYYMCVYFSPTTNV